MTTITSEIIYELYFAIMPFTLSNCFSFDEVCRMDLSS